MYDYTPLMEVCTLHVHYYYIILSREGIGNRQISFNVACVVRVAWLTSAPLKCASDRRKKKQAGMSGGYENPDRANFFFGRTSDLENFSCFVNLPFFFVLRKATLMFADKEEVILKLLTSVY